MKYYCKKCKKTKDIRKQTLIYTENGWKARESLCCGEYMEGEKAEGMPTIIRNETNKWNKEVPSILESKKK